MTVEELCINDLRKLEQILLATSPQKYLSRSDVSGESSVSDLTGVICNLYLQLLDGAENGLVCYEYQSDTVSRINTDLKFAIYTLSKIQANIPKKIKNFPMNLKRINSESNETIALVSTTYCRELLFCLESSLKLSSDLKQIHRNKISNI